MLSDDTYTYTYVANWIGTGQGLWAWLPGRARCVAVLDLVRSVCLDSRVSPHDVREKVDGRVRFSPFRWYFSLYRTRDKPCV